MEGFPHEYAKKYELDRMAITIKEIKDKDIKEIKDLLSSKLSLADYNSKHEVLLAKAAGWATIEANINGRIWASVWLLGAVLVIVNVLYHILFSKA